MKARVVLPGGEMSSFSPQRPNHLGLALLFAIASTISGCSCSQGYPSDGGTDATMDGPPIDGDVPDGDGAAPDADADVELCGNGQLDQDPSGEFGNEVCDPALPPTAGDALRCICSDDGNPCTEDVWVPDPEGGECYGECVHNPIPPETCEDNNPCTLNDNNGGALCTPEFECLNTPIDNCQLCDGGTNGDPCTVPLVDGQCEIGAIACNAMGVETCMQQNFPTAELCDDLDNDCDGMIDEDNPGGDAACNTSLPGVCAAGLTECQHPSGQPAEIVCVQQFPSTAEICDALDNNCDGMINEGNPGSGMTCSTGMMGVCAAGLTTCSGNATACIPIMMPSPEVCDGLDNDCANGPDNGNPGAGQPCITTGLGVCRDGTTACTNGAPACNQNVMPSADVCDGLDNDCDGTADEGNPGGGASCDTGEQGRCQAGTLTCMGAAGVQCVRNQGPVTEVCDAVDNDCDGMNNEGNPGGGQSCTTGQQGICSAGTTACTGNTIVCNRNMNPSPTELCGATPGSGNGLDDNCDGNVDTGVTAPDGFSNACGSATTINVAPGAGSAIQRSGWIDQSGDDYFLVTFTSVAGIPNLYRPRIQLTDTGGGQFNMVVYAGNGPCGGSTHACGSGNGNNVVDFELTYPADRTACSSAAEPDTCSDNLPRYSQFYVRVKRATATATTCSQYTIRFSNQ